MVAFFLMTVYTARNSPFSSVQWYSFTNEDIMNTEVDVVLDSSIQIAHREYLQRNQIGIKSKKKNLKIEYSHSLRSLMELFINL